MKDWHCYIDNQNYGQYPENILRELIDKGQLTVDTYVYNDSPEEATKGWQRAGDTEIAALFLNNPQGTPSLPPIQNTGTSRVFSAATQENAENRPRHFSDKGQARVLRGTSNAPLILGVIGSVLMIPAFGCNVCLIAAASNSSARGSAAEEVMFEGLALIIVLGILPLILGILGGAKGKSSPKKSCLFLAIAAAFAGIDWFLTMFTGLFYLGALILYLVGAIIAYTQKKV
jgi:hypothetical protein